MLRPIRSLIRGALLACTISAPATAIGIPDPAPWAPEERCFADVLAPAQHEIAHERVEVRPAFERERQIPAAIEYQKLRILTKEAGARYLTASPLYQLKPERVMVSPERVIEVDYPAKYETWTEKLELEPAKLIWTPCNRVYGRNIRHSAVNTTDINPSLGANILCRIHVAAKERIVHHTKLVELPRTVLETVPAQYKTIMRQTIYRPGFAQKRSISPEFATLQAVREIAPARTVFDRIPALYEDVERQKEIRSAAIVQAEVLCGQYATRATVSSLQSALVSEGHQIAIDGVYGPETQEALERYQSDNGLAKGFMTVESVRALGVQVEACAPASCGQSAAIATVSATQKALSRAGFPTRADGILGPNTQKALNRFQQANHLPVGYLNAETMEALNIASWI